MGEKRTCMIYETINGITLGIELQLNKKLHKNINICNYLFISDLSWDSMGTYLIIINNHK